MFNLLLRWGERLDAPGLWLPRSLLRCLAAARTWWSRVFLWRRAARRAGYAGVVELGASRRHAAGEGPIVMKAAHALVIREASHRRFLRASIDYPGFRQAFAPAFVSCLREAFVHVPSGAVVTNEGLLVAESVGRRVVRFASRTPAVAAADRRRGAAATIMTNMSRNYYHWLVDCLPRTYLLACLAPADPIALLLPPSLAPFQRCSLACCLPAHSYAEPVASEWVQVERLYFPSYVSDPPTGYLPPDCLGYMRERIFEHLALREGPADRRLYISRSGTQYRRVVNEPEVIAALAPLGFGVHRPEHLSFEAQVRLFHSARVVVGARGAGLANMLFSRRLTLLELTAAPMAGVVYFSLAHALGHDHHHLFSRKVEGGDFLVDVKALKAALGRIGVA